MVFPARDRLYRGIFEEVKKGPADVGAGDGRGLARATPPSFHPLVSRSLTFTRPLHRREP